MNRITFPLKQQMRRIQVADLNQALGLLEFLPAAEKDSQYFGKSTQEAVRDFQEKYQLPVTGVVDEATAQTLNKLLEERGALGDEMMYSVQGVVLGADGKPAIALKVQAFDRDVSREGLLGSTITDEKGFYRITFTPGQFQRTEAERGGPEIFIRVYGTNGETLVQSKTFQDAPPELKLDLILPSAPPIPVKSLVVKGKVAFSNGQAVDNARLKVFDRNLGKEDTLIGQAATDGKGNYAITYSLDQLNGKSAADLVITLYREERLIQTTEVIFNAAAEITKNFTLPALVAPEFQRLTAKIQPLLHNNLKIGALVPEQIQFLSRKTSIDGEKIGRLTQSHALAGTDPALTVFYYGMFSQNMPTDPEALLAKPQVEIRAALDRAVGANQIPPLQLQDVDNILTKTLPMLRADQLLKSIPAGKGVCLSDLFETLPKGAEGPALSLEGQRNVVNLLADNGFNYQLLFDQLKETEFRQKQGFTQKQAVGIERTLRLAGVTLNHPPLMIYFQQKLASEPDPSLNPLTALNRYQWLDLAYTHGVPAGTDHTPETYARQMEMTVDALHPTAMLAARLNSGDLVIRRPGFEKVKTFFNNHPTDFDILFTNISAYAAQHGLDNEAEVKPLLKLQRVKRLSTVWDEAGAMLNNGFDSALDVVGSGLSRVAQCLAGQVAPERISIIYERARQVHDVSLSLMSGLQPRFSPTPIPGVPGSNRFMDWSGLKKVGKTDSNDDYPTLQNLFGPLDTVACDYNQSVLSPAAYFVDLLQFLNPKGKDQFKNPLKVLLERRPDLVDLELSPANTEIELPYIDLVIEILENAIALPRKLDPLPNQDWTTALQTLSEEIIPPLQKTSLGIISRDLQADQETGEQRQLINGQGAIWMVKDQQRRWTLEVSEGTPVTFICGAAGEINSINPLFFSASFPSAYAARLISELEKDQVSDEIKAQIEALIHNKGSIYFQYLFILSWSVSPKVPGKVWELTLHLGVKVAFESINSEMELLKLYNPSGDKPVKERPCSLTQAKNVKDGLDNENPQIVDPLTEFLWSKSNYEITKNTDGSWLICLDVTCEVDSLQGLQKIKSLTYQTVGQSKDLIACPENQNPLAYEPLRRTNFPWTLPFNLPLETVRACLERAGVSRCELMERIHPEDYLNDSNWANETLGISPEEAELIINNKAGDEEWLLWSYWGLIPGADEDWDNCSVYDASAGVIESGEPAALLSKVSILLQQARLNYDDLLRLLKTFFVGSVTFLGRTVVDTFQIEMIDPQSGVDGPCNLMIKQVSQGSGLTKTVLDRLHRFIRLWRKLGWEIEDLDRVIKFFSANGDISDDPDKPYKLLTTIAHIKKLQEMLNVPPRLLLNWWGDMLFARKDSLSLYEQVYLNPQVNQRPDDAFRLNNTKSDLQNTNVNLIDKAPAISAALKLSPADFSYLIDRLKLADAYLDLENLFELYRTTSLAMTLGISIPDYFRIQDLTGFGPFENTEELIDFCEAIRFIRNTGFTADELSYILKHETIPGLPIVLTDDQAAQLLESIRLALQTKIMDSEKRIRELLSQNPPGLIVKKELDPDQAVVIADKAALTLGLTPPNASPDTPISITQATIALPPPGTNGSTFSWRSSNSNILSIDTQQNCAMVHRPQFKAGDASVTLTATIQKGAFADTRDFNLIVIQQDPSPPEAVDADLAALAIGFAPGDSLSSVTQNFTIPRKGFYQSDISWACDPPGFLDNTKEETDYKKVFIKRPDYNNGNTTIQLTATVTNGASNPKTKDFLVTLIKAPQTEKEAVAADIKLINLGIDMDEQFYHVALPFSPGPNGAEISWFTNNSGIVAIDTINHTVMINRPIFGAGDTNVTLTAKVMKGVISDIQDYPITVKMMEPKEVQARDADFALLTMGFALGDSAAHVTRHLTLPTKGFYGSVITWHSGGQDVIADDGSVYRPGFSESDTVVSLAAEIQNGTAPSVTKTFDHLLVVKQTDAEAVAADWGALALDFAPGDYAASVTQPTLQLPGQGCNGSSIVWSSSDDLHFRIDNRNHIAYVTRPSMTEKDVHITLEATLTKGSARAKKIFTSADILNCDPLDHQRLSVVLSSPGMIAQLTDVVVKRVASMFALEMKVVRELLVTDQPKTALLQNSPKPNVLFDPIYVFINLINAAAVFPLSKDNFSDAYQLIYRLQKTAAILSRLKVKPEEMAWLNHPNYGMKVLNFNHLPVNPPQKGIPIIPPKPEAPNLFEEWRQLLILFQLRDQVRGMNALITEYVAALAGSAADPINEARKVIVKGLTLVPNITDDQAVSTAADSLNDLIMMLGIDPSEDYLEPLRLKQMLDLLYTMKKLGADKTQVELLTQAWPKLDPYSQESDPATEAARTARGLLRAKYGADSWNDIIKPISDTLRIKQRDALVDYLKSGRPDEYHPDRKGFRDVNDLYEYYLIDPGMAPCMLTSRLVQATAAVQLFVQRCFLNLELVEIDDVTRKRWEWMKNYRVWEANRKVFLYPENWLYPELRDDKTETFKTLENGLGQGEPTYELGKNNVLEYLDELKELSKITVYGMYESIDNSNSGNPVRTLYIVGRTPNPPYTYYWRQMIIGGDLKHMKWTGWEKITDINDDHAMPFVMDNNLHIAWPTITKKTAKQIPLNTSTGTNSEASDAPADNTTDLHADCWEIKLNWIRRDSKGWTKKKVSSDSFPIMSNEPIFCNTDVVDSRKEITFRIDAQTYYTPQDTVTFSVFNNQPNFTPPESQLDPGEGLDTLPNPPDEDDRLHVITDTGTFKSYYYGYDGIGYIYSQTQKTIDVKVNKGDFDSRLSQYKSNAVSNDPNSAMIQPVYREVRFTVAPYVEYCDSKGNHLWYAPDDLKQKGVTFTYKYVVRPFTNIATKDETALIDVWNDSKNWRTFKSDQILNPENINDYVSIFDLYDFEHECYSEVNNTAIIPLLRCVEISVGGKTIVYRPTFSLYGLSLAPDQDPNNPEPRKFKDCGFPKIIKSYSIKVSRQVFISPNSWDTRKYGKIGRFILDNFGDIKIEQFSEKNPAPAPDALPIADDLSCRANGFDVVLPPKPKNDPITIYYLKLKTEAGDDFSIDNLIIDTDSLGFVVPSAKMDDPNIEHESFWYFEYPDSSSPMYILTSFSQDNPKRIAYYEFYDHLKQTAALRTTAYRNFDVLFLPESQKPLQKKPNLSGGISFSYKVFNTWCTGFAQQVPFSLYNWELLYHAPMLIAEFLTKQQRFGDAQQWLHYVFNPTKPENDFGNDNNIPLAYQFWRFLPFRQATIDQQSTTPQETNLRQIFNWLGQLQTGIELSPEEKSVLDLFTGGIEEWKDKPFRPFMVARNPLRWVSFEWRTIFAYLDNLIAWGDQMFRRFTRESVNEAIQYYVLAAKLLGPRPQNIKYQEQPPAQSYLDLYPNWDEFSNAWYAFHDTVSVMLMLHSPIEINPEARDGILPGFIENPGPNPSRPAPNFPGNEPSGAAEEPTVVLSSLGMLHFGIPANDKLLGYWDTVEDRLFKIRHCMDIDGKKRELPLFAPPIDPLLLVHATAAGLDLDTVLADMNTALMPYRFQIIVQKANEICAEVKALGSALLSALEKRDAEELALLRSGQEVALLNLITQVKQRQVDEAGANIESLNQSRAIAMARFSQYHKLLGKPVALDSSGLPVLAAASSLQVAANAPGEEAGLGLNQYEVGQFNNLSEANGYMIAAGVSSTIASILHCLPDFVAGNSNYLQIKIGGSHFGNATNAVASFLSMLASNANHEANVKGMMASYQRRQDEWVFQSKLALEEIKQIDKQILAAKIRLDIAQKELDNHLKQVDNAQAVDEFMHDKYTNRELYSWMSGQISNIYFSSYQLAYDLAKRAEKAFRHELGLADSNFIQFGYWDSLKKGLLAGENLSLDLKRMEVAYLEQNERELEITKQVSLALLDPLSLLDLKENGECQVDLSESLFDLDYPGHYLRRIKSVSMTIPCVAGPYTNINCTLTLLKSSVRTKPALMNNQYRRIDQNDTRFVDSQGAVQSIATSHGQNDSGLFEVNFRDERYLPFEGAGVISTWILKMPQACNAFDMNTISDVVIQLKYTARDGGEMIRQAALDAATPKSGICLFSACHDFSGEWYRFLNPPGSEPQKFVFTLGPGQFPFSLRGKTIQITQMNVFIQPPEGMNVNQINEVQLKLSPIGQTINLAAAPDYRGMLYGTVEIGDQSPAQFKLDHTNPLPPWTLENVNESQEARINAKELIVVCHYMVAKNSLN